MNQDNLLLAFMLTFLAGISTGIGGILAFFIKKENTSFLALGLGFSAGVMIYISFMEILPQSQNSLTEILGKNGAWLALLSFFIGIGITAVIDKLVPENINPHEPHLTASIPQSQILVNKLKRTGVFTAIALAIHNFPEGLATFMAALTNPKWGISIAAAIAIHNIPEGISVAMPIYHATDNKKLAFTYSFLSGLAEPIGAIIGFFFLNLLFNSLSLGIIFAMVAGIMIYISFDELLPMAREYAIGHTEILGLVLGMMVMAVSIQLF